MGKTNKADTKVDAKEEVKKEAKEIKNEEPKTKKVDSLVGKKYKNKEIIGVKEVIINGIKRKQLNLNDEIVTLSDDVKIN